MYNIFPRSNSFINKLTALPYFMLAVLFVISLMGFLVMYAAGQGSFSPWLSKQLIHFIVCIPLMLIVATTDIRFIFRWSYVFYAISLIMLVLVGLKGHTAMGATRWINLGIVKLQPSEIMKINLVLALARYFHNMNQANIDRVVNWIPPLLISLLPFILILKQPDLGTGTILLIVAVAIFFLTGINLKIFFVTVIFAIASIPVAWNFLHEYQKQRVYTFLNPEADPLGAGYNIIQSKIAIGSGGLWGKGLLKGTQSQLNFLPEHHTDFAFTALAEEQGFIFCIILLILYGILIYNSMVIAINSRSHYGRVVASGIAVMFFVHVFVNIGMVMGLLPVVGAPLPFISYGGTIMITIMLGFGLIFNVHVHHNVHISKTYGEMI
jgi:rod shape determining protein RodA